MNLNATIFGQAIAFIFFVVFCMKYIWPPIIKSIEKRQKDIIDSFAAIEKAKQELLITKDQTSEYILQIKLKAKEIIEQANKNKDQLIYKAKQEAEIERKKILDQAKIQIDYERKKIYEELKIQVIDLALASAEKIINQSLKNKTINNELINNIIKKII
ncbi:F0F1 ATP synthase subunit B [Candidatus Palibaumannia cicadellinicola]|uniref:ATP synthase subunit b n=1 Tax=Candidatus Palibaumannia cicadellinicola TaxID=186490 RepID=A0A0K2BL13_9GAMM|nr:F0F1 ATP synthase subunit B [Candidatus Baumannia cicadellinicola]AKZ65743.1 ATP synthase B chain [Candidatus Baumannia cicadellinicola]